MHLLSGIILAQDGLGGFGGGGVGCQGWENDKGQTLS